MLYEVITVAAEGAARREEGHAMSDPRRELADIARAAQIGSAACGERV